MAKVNNLLCIFRNSGGSPVSKPGSIADALKTEIGNVVTRKSFKVACAIADSVTDFAVDKPYKDVTGNLSQSMGVAVVGSNSKRGTLSVGRYYSPAKRMAAVRGLGIKAKTPSLDWGEAFKGKVYPDGTPVTRRNLYHGETDVEPTYGTNEREKYLQKLRSIPARNKNTVYTVHAFYAMPYANYNNIKHGQRLMGSLHEAFETGLSEYNMNR